MALLHAVNSGVSHQVERTAQKCFLLPRFYFCEILLLQLPPPRCPGAAGVGRCQQEQLGQAMFTLSLPAQGQAWAQLPGFPLLVCQAPLPWEAAEAPQPPTNPAGVVSPRCAVLHPLCRDTLRT